ncbi:hypothetical protein [Vibrio sp. MED222]|uniref:hypothetical protein n=1 Tax=Vibrio sp. MED222 TaxID=314290 RepID=UPI000068EC54|nr:hypothetical protein [Vibrio sp. MED222]EAQ55530.1 hypothetical protein MED222_08918 [Vibrio sp. MED222]
MLKKKTAGRPPVHRDKIKDVQDAIDQGYTVRSIMEHFKISQTVYYKIKEGTY